MFRRAHHVHLNMIHEIEAHEFSLYVHQNLILCSKTNENLVPQRACFGTFVENTIWELDCRLNSQLDTWKYLRESNSGYLTLSFEQLTGEYLSKGPLFKITI